MDILAETYLKYSPKPIEDLIGKKRKNQVCVELEEIKEYATEDADITFQELFTAELDKTETIKLLTKLRFR
jgi:DNA polymerase-1